MFIGVIGAAVLGHHPERLSTTRPPTAVRRGCPILRPMVSSMVIGGASRLD